MAEHTPTPWRVNGNAIWSNDGYVAELSCPRGAEARDADAAFIVKAVNSHDALVNALQNARRYIDTVIVNTPDKKKKRNFGECLRIIDDALTGAA